VYVFKQNKDGPNNWGQDKKLVASDAAAEDRFGEALASNGDLLVVGAPLRDEVGVDSGAAYVFSRVGGWPETAKLTASNLAAGDELGTAVSVSNVAAIVGSPRSAATIDAGSAYVYTNVFAQPINYCVSGTTASGCQAVISATGTPSASSATGFDVAVTNVEGLKDGLIYFSVNGQQSAPWGNSQSGQCVVPPARRTGLQVGVGTNGGCDGVFQLDFNAWMTANPTKAPESGDVAYMQCWFRDPLNPSNKTSSLSNAMKFAICP
jgi:hypothetical protein